MRRALIIGICLALAIPLALAGPAAAKKPKPPPSPAIEMSIAASPGQVITSGDVIFYDLIVTNQAEETLNDVTITITVSGPEPEAAWGGVTLQPGVAWDGADSYLVTDHDMDGETIVATLAVHHGGAEIGSAVAAVMVYALPRCPDAIVGGSGEFDGGVCYYPFAPGYWKITAVPDKRPVPPLNMRDHVPGNFCVIGESGSKQLQTIDVYLPDDGVCLLGGHGVCTDPDCYFAVGNPANFVLSAPKGTVAATYLAPPPG
jgi:hypothetical protein